MSLARGTFIVGGLFIAFAVIAYNLSNAMRISGALALKLQLKRDLRKELKRQIWEEITKEMKTALKVEIVQELGAELKGEAQQHSEKLETNLGDKLVVELDKAMKKIEEVRGRAPEEMAERLSMENIKLEIIREIEETVSKGIGETVDGIEDRRAAARPQHVQDLVRATHVYTARKICEQLDEKIKMLRETLDRKYTNSGWG